MMNDKEYEARFIKGFNDGYLLSRFQPQLYEKISKTKDIEQPYFRGLEKGHKEYQRELFLQNLKNTRAVNEKLKHKPRM